MSLFYMFTWIVVFVAGLVVGAYSSDKVKALVDWFLKLVKLKK